MLGLTRADSILVIGRDSAQVGRHLAPWVRQAHSAADGSSLRLAAGSLDWVIVDGSMQSDRDFPSTVALLLTTLKPGGRLLVTFDNRRGLGRMLGAQHRSKSVNSGGVPCRGLPHALELMASAGCSRLEGYVVLPNHSAARTIIPLEPPCPPAAEKFALDQAWKRASTGRALGRLALHLLIDLHALRHLYPAYVVVGRKAC